jgi:hypothetical protein
MSSVLASVATGLPALLGVLGGILILVGTRGAWLVAFGGLVLACIFLLFGRLTIGRFPILGFVLIQMWILAAISVMALGTAGVLWLTIHAPEWFGGASDDRKEALSGALMGAVTAYLALLWTEDISAGEGPFWPSTQFRSALSTAFSNHTRRPNHDTREYDAIFLDRVRAGGPSGWGFTARLERAKIIRAHLKSPVQ